MNNLLLTRKLIGVQVKVMQDFIKFENGEKISLSSCYNCIAKMWGFENWNVFSAKLNEIEQEDN